MYDAELGFIHAPSIHSGNGVNGTNTFYDYEEDGARKIAIYADRITTLAHANQVLTRFHTRRREDIESGARPTIQESLARLN